MVAASTTAPSLLYLDSSQETTMDRCLKVFAKWDSVTGLTNQSLAKKGPQIVALTLIGMSFTINVS